MRQQQTIDRNLSESGAAATPGAPATVQQPAIIERSPVKRRLPWYMALLCRVGVHEGRWEYLGEGHCIQIKACGRCGATKVRTRHRIQWRYLGVQTCEQRRTCTRCATAGRQRTKHEQWSESWVDQPGSGWTAEKRAHRCQRCGFLETWTVSTSYD